MPREGRGLAVSRKRLVVLPALLQDVAETEPRLARAGPQRQSPLEAGPRPNEIALLQEHDAKVAVGLDKIGLECERPAIARHRLAGLAPPPLDIAELAVKLEIPRSRRQRLFEMCRGLVEPSLLAEQIAEVDVGLDIVGPKR